MRENAYQASLIRKLKRLFPGCVLLKNDSAYLQGIPDWIMLYGPYWAALEIKASADSRHRPNQDYYVEMLDDMSFAAFIFPENEEEVLRDLQSALGPRRSTRISRR